MNNMLEQAEVLPGTSKGIKRGRPVGSKQNEEQAAEPHSKRYKKPLIGLEAMTQIRCCPKTCIGIVTKYSMETAKELRGNFQKLTMSLQTQWILDYLRDHSDRMQDGKVKFVFILGTTSVCSNAWYLVLGISETRLRDLMNKIKDGQYSRSPRTPRYLVNAQEARAWLTDYVSKYSDKMPDSNKLHLPCCLTRRAIYQMYEESIIKQGSKPASESHFYRIWRIDFNHVCIPKMNRFAKCDNCQAVKEVLISNRDKENQIVYRQFREQHLKQQQNERLKYYKHRNKASENTSKYMSMIIDGMDQSKTALPHFDQQTKSTSNLYKLRMHVTGVLVHGHHAYGFFDYGQFPHSSNLTMSILLDVFYMFRDSLPPNLYLQMDNCCRENKNKYIFAFCCLLVELKVFKKIKIGFLMVGHTHEDIDQLFSRFSQRLGWNSAKTIPQLMDLFENSFTPKPTSVLIEKLFNITEWISPYISKNVQGHTKPHLYKIELNQKGKACIKTKGWSTDASWQSCDGAHEGVLLQDIPPGAPNVVKPDKLDSLDWERCKSSYKSGAASRMNQKEQKWWETFIAEVDQQIEGNSRPTAEEVSLNMPDDDWRLPSIVASRQIASPTHEPAEQFVPLPSKLAKELNPITPIIIGPKKKGKNDLDKPIAEGDMCLLDLLEYPGELQIAKVLNIEGDNITIQWYQGSKTSKIKPFPLVKKGKGRVAWTQTVQRCTIWHHGFKLTKSGLLSKDTVRIIDEFYDY